MPNHSWWRGRRVLVTGHTGFKGPWLVRWLKGMGAELTGLALPPPSTPALFDVAGIAGDLRSVIGDIRDLATVREVVRAAAPEVVFHLAAQSLVRPSLQDPVGTYHTNVLGTVHVLEAIRREPSVRAVVIVTSDKCYENPGPGAPPFREDDPMGGSDPYSNSKGCAELATAAYRRSFFSGHAHGAPNGHALIATARAGNVIGGGDWALDRLVPDLVRGWVAARPTPIRYPEATRPWQHVLEPLSGYLLLAERLGAGEAEAAAGWNFGPDLRSVVPVRVIADHMVRGLGGPAAWRLDGTPQAEEAATLALDSTRARERLGWSPTWSLEEALDRTAAWYHDWRTASGPADLGRRMDDDIARYERDAGRPSRTARA